MILSRNLQDIITGVPLDDLSTSLHLVEPNLTYSGPNIIMVTLTEQLIRNSLQMRFQQGVYYNPSPLSLSLSLSLLSPLARKRL